MPTPADVQAAVNALSNVGKLVHLAWRMDIVTQQEIGSQIFKHARREYEGEMSRLASSVGCGKRRGRLGEGPRLTEVRRESDRHSESIALTYNLDLARAIAAIATEIPTANRNTYSARLRTWENARARWKCAANNVPRTKFQRELNAVVNEMQFCRTKWHSFSELEISF